MQFSNPPLQLPGNSFSIWTRPVLGIPVPKPARYLLPDRSFTIWTRSQAQPAVRPATASPAPVRQVTPKASSWAGRAALLGLPVVAGLWIFDHLQNGEALQRLGEEQRAQAETSQHLRDQAAMLTKSLEERAALLTDVDSKSRSIASERDAAMQTIKSSQEARKAADATLQTKLAALTKALSEVATLKQQAAEKEGEFTQSLNALRSEFSQLKQTADQKEADLQNALAKLEADKAAAVNEAAKAASQVRELTTRLEKAAKEAPAPPAEPKP